MTKEYLLYGAPPSLFTGKIRSYLRYKRIPYKEILATRQVYRDVIVPRTGVRFIPVVVTPEDEAIQDSTVIIDTLESRFGEPSIYPKTPKQRLTALLFELYADEWLVIPAMHYRWKYNEKYVIREFGKIAAPGWPKFLQPFAGRKIANYFRPMVKRLGVTDRTERVVERQYLDFLDRLDAHFENHPYLLGGRASIGDFGLMGPLYGHAYREPHSSELLKTRAPRVIEWIERLNSSQAICGDFLADDEVPETLHPILKTQFSDQFPVLADTVARLERWVKENPNAKIPRAIGHHEFKLEDVTERRVVMPYAQWMLQRPLDFYKSLSGTKRHAVDEFLSSVDGLRAMQMQIKMPVTRRKNRVVLA